MKMFEFPSAGDRRYQQVAQDLIRCILAGEFAPGSRLPPERELAVRYEVSRATLREAMLALELMRHVEIRVGSGIFVLPQIGRNVSMSALDVPELEGPWEVLHARRVIEGEAAALAAERGTDAQIAAIGRALEIMAASINDVPRFDHADTEFHMLIAKASGNGIFETYVGHLWRMRESPMWDRWYSRTRSAANRRKSAAEHGLIQRAIHRRLPAAARTAMEAHLDTLAERFFDLRIEE
ncbi:FadR family transcriptional regulator [Tianweitania sp. BSSL-BM11]|uniref:FadR family transcriptional regulator n=1 Tax=Tianweitania aestuarii TaxID=2814886 RepID=A0ABS5RYE5_9HYPH|nr:FadR/GntR family transcriptional regulator [Tianweitania aestuarii]MBS9722074.1 FadR family transcriptional regulator [Tianweitania aestuarii]